MAVATYLLFALGILGALDIAIYHSVSHGIRHHPDSRQELIVHFLRGPTYAALFLLIPNVAMHGLFFWLLMGLFALDVVISLVDFALERHSREFLGGLPSGEYVLHVIIAMVFGALVTSVCYGAGEWGWLATQLIYQPANVHWVLRLVLAIMAVFVLISGIQDLIAAIRLRHEPERAATGS